MKQAEVWREQEKLVVGIVIRFPILGGLTYMEMRLASSPHLQSKPQNKLLPTSYAGIYSLAMAFLAVITLLGRWTFLPIQIPILPIVATPKVTAIPPSEIVRWEEPIPTISIDRHGRIFVGRKIVALDQLRDELTEAQKQSGIRYGFVLNADKCVPYEKVISIVRTVRTLGVERVGLVASY